MKKLIILFCAAAALLAGLSGCMEKPEEALDSVDLRYLADDTYQLDAISPKAFTLVVKSTKPWVVRNQHKEWCTIDIEEGEAVEDSLVHVGKGENTNVHVQYYDNLSLDDRIDKIEIASGKFIGKRITVYQKGIAYLRIPADEEEFMLEKAGGDVTFHVLSNQNWSAKVIEGDWITIKSGATGSLDGEVVLQAAENTGEKRYASVAVYDRLDEERAVIKFTQDGVQLDPESFELRLGYDQTSAELAVVANAKWVATKASEGDDWFTIDNPDGHTGDDVLKITVQNNADGTALRKASILLKTVPAKEGDAVAEKEIVLKQAYPLKSTRTVMDNDEMSNWKSDWTNAPSYTKDVGTLFTAKARLNRGDMPFGTYTFHWTAFAADPASGKFGRVRHWFCFSEGCELKADIRPGDGKVSYDFNAAGDGNKPSVDGFTSVDFSKPVEVTYKFDPSGSEYCHVTYLVNGTESGSFDTSASMLRTITWGAKINMYVGVDEAGSAILEWFEFTPPMNWDE